MQQVPLQNIGASSLPAAADPDARHRHAVQFYENEHFLSAAVADFLADGLNAGETVIAIITDAHRESFALRLRAKGIDAAGAAERGQLVWCDARALLSEFTVQGLPVAERFTSVCGGLIESARMHSAHGVRAYGEMVDLLWKDGNIEGAIQLEDLWNDLQRAYRFSLLCAYAMGNFYKATDAAAFERICTQHSHVHPTESYVSGGDQERLREVSLLQQRARALETEILHREELEQRLRVALASKIHAEEELRRSLADREVLLERERSARAEAESASRAKNEFLAVMSHELRTPLNAIGGHVQLIEMGIHGPVVEAQREALQRIERSQRHLLSLINDILNLTRIEAGRVQYAIEELALESLMRDVKSLLDPLLSRHQLEVRGDSSIRKLGDRTLVVRGDREKVQQILLNLLSNAIKFTPAGGRIMLEIGRHAHHPLAAMVEVSDTGIGIEPGKLETIFQPFVQLAARPVNRPDGVGLGLSISRELARGMGGDLTVRSDVGRGTTFTLTLPLA